MRRVQWSRDALEDIKSQVAYIASDNPVAARRVADRIRKIGNDLGEMATGRPGRVHGTYEKPISDLPFTVAYAIDIERDGSEVVTVLRVVHGARHWPVGQWPED